MIQRNVLIGVTGSVATIKLPEILEAMERHFPGSSIKVVATNCAIHFIPPNLRDTILTDKDEWSQWTKKGDPVLHIELRKWADIFLVAPLDANSMAKAANGICDNLLTCILRAWEFDRKPLLAVPAMNTAMWNHPVTIQHANTLREYGYIFVDPLERELACGDTGMGAMADVATIMSALSRTLSTINL